MKCSPLSAIFPAFIFSLASLTSLMTGCGNAAKSAASDPPPSLSGGISDEKMSCVATQIGNAPANPAGLPDHVVQACKLTPEEVAAWNQSREKSSSAEQSASLPAPNPSPSPLPEPRLIAGGRAHYKGSFTSDSGIKVLEIFASGDTRVQRDDSSYSEIIAVSEIAPETPCFKAVCAKGRVLCRNRFGDKSGATVSEVFTDGIARILIDGERYSEWKKVADLIPTVPSN